MLYYVLAGFVFGGLIPYMARRFAKFMPATPAYALCQLFRPGQGAKKQNEQYKKLAKTYYWRSFVAALFTACLTYAYYWRFGAENFGWCVFYLWTLLLLAEIDWRMFLLPDILTVPLLIGGFVCAAWGHGWVIGAESALGAVVGYLLPVLVSLLLVWKNKDAFGGGDIKFLAAIGAWVGFEPLIYVLATASILMLVYSLLRRQKAVAFGPALSLAAIIVAFLFF